MKALIQLVSQASVTVDEALVGSSGAGMLVFVGVDADDDQEVASKIVNKILNLRIFRDEVGKTNLNIQQVQGDLLVVSQFTLSADTSRGLRPGFSQAAKPDHAKQLFDFTVEKLKASGLRVETGEFGAMMQVSLVNEGPSTYWLDSQNKI